MRPHISWDMKTRIRSSVHFTNGKERLRASGARRGAHTPLFEYRSMSNKKIWYITGASRGMGADFAKAALAAGHAVVATGRDSDGVSKALGHSNDLLAVKLDVTSRADAEAAMRAAVNRFGRIDVLVNNAASFYAGYFEELTPEQMEFWKAQNGKQSGDPAKLARALIIIASQEPPPRRFVAGADAIATAEQKISDLKAQIDANRNLSTALAFDEIDSARNVE